MAVCKVADDCLVVRLVADKRYCFLHEPPGALITVVPVEG